MGFPGRLHSFTCTRSLLSGYTVFSSRTKFKASAKHQGIEGLGVCTGNQSLLVQVHDRGVLLFRLEPVALHRLKFQNQSTARDISDRVG
jgi:hypothetical protein